MSGRYIWINFPYLLDKFCPPWIDLFEAMSSVCSPRQQLISFLVLCEIPKYLILELTGLLQTSFSGASGTARTSHFLTFNVKPDDDNSNVNNSNDNSSSADAWDSNFSIVSGSWSLSCKILLCRLLTYHNICG